MKKGRPGKFAFACGMLALLLLLPGAAGASGYSVLYSFAGGSAGTAPETALYADSAGNLYGTTEVGGDTLCGGCGTVFEVAPDGTETVLYAFTDGKDGGYPLAGVMMDAAGNLVGTTSYGGNYGAGTVFAVRPNGSERTLYTFCARSNCKDGAYPYAGLIADSVGNLYGTTLAGGNTKSAYCPVAATPGCGTIFEVATDGKETVLHDFRGRRDGAYPQAALYADSGGNLYGTTAGGGSTGCGGYGCGTVFKVARDGTETIVHAFRDGKQDGAYPVARLIADSAGNLYSTTNKGGAYDCGTVFRIATDGSESLLYSFKGKRYGDGEFPQAGLLIDASGNLYGTTVNGGTRRRHSDGDGIIFELATNGTEIVLYPFCSETFCKDGSRPYGDLTWKASDQTTLYGTASQNGAHGHGVVFSYTLTPGKKK
ncbi:MAG TPA: choice-of-anchor tandem repeat GloVer-containing protein [Rhizomicrobium sp.]|nr:choice-of-anchor tandem repeat GloVer-containing protein [Rhizomicrobium sp.]